MQCNMHLLKGEGCRLGSSENREYRKAATRAVRRKYYVHPALPEAYHLGIAAPHSQTDEKRKTRRELSQAALRRDENSFRIWRRPL
jgi:hypothetical protein